MLNQLSKEQKVHQGRDLVQVENMMQVLKGCCFIY